MFGLRERRDLLKRLECNAILLFVFVGLIAVLGLSVVWLAVLCKKRMMEGNNE